MVTLFIFRDPRLNAVASLKGRQRVHRLPESRGDPRLNAVASLKAGLSLMANLICVK